MSQRTLTFVPTAADAGSPAPNVDIVVLDTAWTPTDDERAARPDIRPIRPALEAVLARVDLFDGSLTRLDAWAEAAQLADRLVLDDVSWWFRLRMMVRWDMHELMLWRHVLGHLLADGAYASVRIPEERAVLARAAAADPRGTIVHVVAAEVTHGPRGSVERAATLRTDAALSARRALRRIDAIGRRVLRRPPRQSSRRRAAQIREVASAACLDRLDARVEMLSATPGGVLAIASARFFQVLHEDGAERFVDPHLALVLDRLAAGGTPVATLALALDHRRDTDRVRIDADERLLPDSYVRSRWSIAEDEALDAADALDRLAAASNVPLDVDGWDLGPAIHAILIERAPAFLAGQRRWLRLAMRALRHLRPGVILLDHEGVRTVWLAAARRCGIPVVAVQHGAIYPNNPEYCHPLHPALVRPDVTCVYGRYEHDVLVEGGGYEPSSVVVTGSSRADPDRAAVAHSPEERAAVRRELGVRDGDRLLVVSVAHSPILGDVHSVCMVARLLGGPLPGVHVVFKLHPQERSDPPYERVLRGLARAHGHEAPAMTSVRDTDLFRLLRSADAHLGQYSTVNTDAVVAGTPTLLAVGQAYADMLGYVDAGVAIPVRDVDDVRAALAGDLQLDEAARRRFLDTHFRRGDATGRIVEVIERSRRDPGPPIDLRRATLDDADLLLAWANDPITRAAGFHPDPIDAATHRTWLAARLAEPTTRLYIGSVADLEVGVVRVEGDADGAAEIGISVAAEARGRGVGRVLLAAALAAAGADDGPMPITYVAFVRTDNPASIALFRGAGFSAGPPTERRGIPCLRFERDA